MQEQLKYIKQIYISPVGRSGNQLFQYVLALFFKKYVAHADIFCNKKSFLTELGISIEHATIPSVYPYKLLVIKRHDFDVTNLMAYWIASADTIIHIQSLACRMDLFFPLRHYYQNLFTNLLDRDDPTIHGWDESKLVINIRLEDILSNAIHANYPPLPFSFYHWLLRRTKLEPVFLGQLGNDRISNALRSSFPYATFCPSKGTRIDFQIMRRSKHVLTSVSTFSYLACFLSTTCISVHVPAYGFFNPKDRPDCQFMVHDNDGIFHYYDLPSIIWRSTDDQIDKLIDLQEDDTFDIINLKEMSTNT